MKINLEKTFKISYFDGEKNTFKDVETLYFKEPNHRHKDDVLRLKKLFIEAQFKLASSLAFNQKEDVATAPSQEELDKKQVVRTVLFGAEGFDINIFFDNFKKLFSKEICFKDEELKQHFSAREIEEIDNDDLENCIIEYCAFFFWDRWSQFLKK